MVVDRYGRWSSVIRAQRPALLLSYPFLIAPTLPLLGLIMVATFREGHGALRLVLGVWMVRVSVAILARRRSGSRRHVRSLIADAIVSDALLWMAFGRALFSTRIHWRGASLRIVRGGLFREDG